MKARAVGRDGGGLACAPLGDNLTYRQLDHWTRRGYLKPGHAAPGSGSWRTWPYQERRVARMMARLVHAGLTVKAAHAVARAGGRLELGPGVQVTVDGPTHPNACPTCNPCPPPQHPNGGAEWPPPKTSSPT